MRISLKELRQTQKLLLEAFQGLGPENRNQVQEIQAFKKLVNKQREELPKRNAWGLAKC